MGHLPHYYYFFKRAALPILSLLDVHVGFKKNYTSAVLLDQHKKSLVIRISPINT